MKGATSVVSVNRFDIESFVNEATWKDILMELVKKDELNPWDIDIIDIVGRYVEVVRGLKVLDLRIPANIVLAAAILLRLKSDMLELEEKADEELIQEEMQRPYVAVEGLATRLRLPQKRRVSLNELIVALEEAMKLKEYRETQAATTVQMMPMVFSHFDVETEAENMFALVKQNLDASKMLTFSLLCELANKNNKLLEVFIPLLFLASKDRIILLQEDFFGEIIIALN